MLTGLPILVVAAVLVFRRRPARGSYEQPGRGLLRWLLLALALFAWEIYELFSKPRHDYPTLSSIGDFVLRTSRVTHAFAFAAWLGVGAFLARRAWKLRPA